MEAILKLIAFALFLFFSFMSLLKFLASYRAKRLLEKRVEFIKDGILFFYSERCAACRLMKPEIQKLKGSFRVMEIDVLSPDGARLAKEFGLMATPTTLVVKDNIVQKVFVGLVKVERLMSAL